MKTLFSAFLLCLTLAFTAQAQSSADKEYQAAMTKMLEVSNSLDAMKQMAPQIVAMVKQQAPDAPQAFWDDMEKTMNTMYDEIIKAIIPIYQKYLTLQDIQGIVAFYKSPVGKKLAASNTKIAMETMPIAQQIAMQTMQKLMENAKAKGYIK